MKRLSTLIIIAWLSLSSSLIGQTITVSGTVTSSAEGGGPVSGASVQLKDTNTGTNTDSNGSYSITIPTDAAALVFSSLGMISQELEIAGRTVINVIMEPEIYSLDEVVVTTGYEIKRGPRSTTSFTQVLDGEKVNAVRQTNINNALAGKVAGIQFRGQSPIILDRTGSIRMRGDGGFGTGNSLLFVVDGTILPNSADINLDDIEDISVLSGPAASAILGSQGANGAVIITTKNASDNREMEIEINSGVMISSVYLLPEFQNEYAGGGVDTLIQYHWIDSLNHPPEWQSLDGKYYHDYNADYSWGPRMEGQEYIPWYAWYPGSKYTGTTARLAPQPNNVRDFYERGWTTNNNISFAKAGDAYKIRAIVGNVVVKGNLPGSSMRRSNFTLKSSFNLGKRLTLASNVSFFTTLTHGEFNDGVNNPSAGLINQFFHRNIDMKIMNELKGLRTPGGIYASWNHNNPNIYNKDNPKDFYAAMWCFNPFTYFDNFERPSRSDRLFGDISLRYKIIEELTIKLTYRRQQNSSWGEERYSSDLGESQLMAAGWWSSPKAIGYYGTYTGYANRENFESLISFNKKRGDIAINAEAGSDFFRAISKTNSANTVNGLVIPNLYSIENSLDQPQIANTRTNEKYRALFLRGDVGFRNYLFGEFTLRNDWHSALPPSNNNVLSKSFGVALVFSDLLDLPFLDFGKVRISWGEIPTTIPIYTYPGGQYSYSLYQWNANLMTTTPDMLVNNTIHGAVKIQREVGLDARFLGNRIGVAATFWDGYEKDIPYPVTIASYSGYTTRYMNTGEIIKQGLDLSLRTEPLSGRNLTYEMEINFSYLIKNKVAKISEDESGFVAEHALDWGLWPGAPSISHVEGQPWGVLKGTGMKMWNGKPMLNDNGTYVATTKYYGSVLPRITGGIQNSFTILRDFTLTANLEYQVGGKYFSFSDVFGSRAGVTARTTGYNDLGNPIRDPVDKNAPDRIWVSGDEATQETGGVHISGVDAETLEKVDYYIDAQNYFKDYLEFGGIFDPFVYDLTYLRLRELSIGYNVPVAKISAFSNRIRNVHISLMALNPWLIYAENRGLDPSEVSNAGGELGQLPGTRSYGINLRINF